MSHRTHGQTAPLQPWHETHPSAAQLPLPLWAREPAVLPGALLGDSTLLDALVTHGQRFACLYADPPWQYTNTATRAAARNHYATLTLEALQALPVRQLTATNAHLHLWTTNAMLPEALQVMRAWGFSYKTMLVWCKPHIGLGNYWRNATEVLLLGVKGSLPFRDHGQRNWVVQKRGVHSRKPDRIRHLIETVSPPAYLELFAREAVPNWVCWGNAIEPTLLSPPGCAAPLSRSPTR